MIMWEKKMGEGGRKSGRGRGENDMGTLSVLGIKS